MNAMVGHILDIGLFVAVLSVLVIVHEFGHFYAAKRAGVRVDVFSVGFGRKLFSRRKGGTEYAISALPLGGYVKLAGDNYDEFKGNKDEYLAQPAGKRFHIIFYGPALNYVLGLALFWLVHAIGYPALTARVGRVLDGMGAQQAGLRAGDMITGIEGKAVGTWDDLQRGIRANESKDSIDVTALRDGQTLHFRVPLNTVDREDEFQQKRKVGLMGVEAKMDEFIEVRYGLVQSLARGASRTVELTGMTYRALGLMITRRMSVKESVTGPLGMFMVTSQAAKLGAIALLQLMAVLSISLAIFNLLPLPALDGGHLFLLGLEKVRGRQLGRQAEDVFNRVGLGFIFTLAALVFYNDLVRFGVIEKIRHLIHV